MRSTTTLWTIRHVLDGLVFPAQKWQILAQADLYGVDSVNRKRLHGLPQDTYEDIEVIATALDDDFRQPFPRPLTWPPHHQDTAATSERVAS